jgi:EAL domain-containing protein (putative c-di-GMP-specific phosphodiesterase class I)
LVGIADRLGAIAAEEAHALVWLEDEELAALLMKKTDKEQAERLITRIYEAFKAPMLNQNSLLRISASCGIAIAETENDSVETLFRNACHALNRAKKLGRGKHLFYDKTMMAELDEIQHVEDELQRALENGEFCAYYQPQFDMYTKKIVGFEALARWNDPVKGLRYPGEFIEVAEETGQILHIGETVLREACAFETRIVQEFGQTVPMSVNISAHQLEQNDFAEFIQNITAEHGLLPEYLSIEITESMLMNNFIDAIDKIIKLKELGIKVHLDDFGTGYSSLNYIKNMPIDVVKIDKAFIQDLGNPQADHLIEFIISLVHKLGKKIIAEGVETEEQWDQLSSYSCDAVQGYYMGKPVPEEVVLSLLRTSFERDGIIARQSAAQ